MLIAPVIARLKAQAPIFAGRVSGAGDLPIIEEQMDFPVPHAFVVPLEDNVSEDLTAGGVTQVIDETISVIVSVSNAADERGQAAVDNLEPVRQELFTALLDWPPAAGYDGFVYLGGFIVGMDRARLLWRYDFSAGQVVQS